MNAFQSLCRAAQSQNIAQSNFEPTFFHLNQGDQIGLICALHMADCLLWAVFLNHESSKNIFVLLFSSVYLDYVLILTKMDYVKCAIDLKSH
jgi:hypothetical protein